MKIKQVISFIGALIVLIGSIGIPLYKHTCLHEDLTIRTVFTPSDHCETVSCDAVKIDLCCKKDLKKVIDKQCCDDEVSAFKLPLNFYENNPVSFQFEAGLVHDFPFFNFDSQQFVVCKKSLLTVKSNAPPLGVSERLPLICIWRL